MAADSAGSITEAIRMIEENSVTIDVPVNPAGFKGESPKSETRPNIARKCLKRTPGTEVRQQSLRPKDS